MDRLRRDHDNKKGKKNPEQEVKEFLAATSRVGIDDKPTITQHYADTFSAVDRFNQLLGQIHVPLRSSKPELVWLYGVIRTNLVNAWSYKQECNKAKMKQDEEASFKQFIRSVIKSLRDRK